MKQTFIEKIKTGNPQIGTLITLPSPEITEIFSMIDYDWLFIDMEHASMSYDDAQLMLQVIKNDCSGIIRIPANDPVWIKKTLDTGCDGIIVPFVNSIDDARKAVTAAKYPPQGFRSVGISRAQGYGRNFSEYIKSANEKTALIIQIEHIDAVQNVNEILAVDGIDGIFIGPYDLSGSLGLLGDVTNPKVQEAIRTIKEACKQHSKPFGIFVMNPDAAQKEIADGCSFIAVGIDTVMLANTATINLKVIKK